MCRRTLYFVSFLLIFLFNCIELQAKDEIPEGWNKWDTQNVYEVGIDTKVFYSPPKSYYIKFIGSVSKSYRYMLCGHIHQYLDSKEFLGKRIKVSAFLKGDNPNGKALLFIHVLSRKDGKEEYLRQADDPIAGITGTTNWKQCSVVADVPENAYHFLYGLYIEGEGRAGLDR